MGKRFLTRLHYGNAYYLTASMSPTVQLKFTKDGITRCVAFTQLPSWLEISAKLTSLYGIPAEHVAISYIDGDGDEVTVSSQEELEAYYNPSPRRLFVIDLSLIRSVEKKPSSDTSSITHRLRKTPSHNTFGTRDASATQSRVVTSTPGDKGKGGEHENTSPAASVLASDTPGKPPVHVYQVTGHDDPLPSDTTINIQEVRPSTAPSTNDAPGPPLAELDPPAAGPAPTFTGDVAFFLWMTNVMLAQNPQLTAAFRIIMQDIGSGAYWAAHRDQPDHAAGEARRSSSNTQANSNPSEADAARQIAEAIKSIVRSFAPGAPPHGGEHVPGGWPNPFHPPLHGQFPPHRESHRHHRHHHPDGKHSHSDSSGESIDDAEADVSMYGVSQDISLEERKAKFLAAKAEYKAQKALYLTERRAKRTGERKSNTVGVCVGSFHVLRLGEQSTDLSSLSDVTKAATRVASVDFDVNSPADLANQSDPLLISQGRGQFPSLETVNVPCRHHTMSGGTIHSPYGRDSPGPTNRTTTVEVRRVTPAPSHPFLAPQPNTPHDNEELIDYEDEDEIVAHDAGIHSIVFG